MNSAEDFIRSYAPAFHSLYNVSENELLKFYLQAKYPGYPTTPGGSAWESELKALYCAIRILRPKNIVEIGNYIGTSANHILQAVADNGEGVVTLVDIWDRLQYDNLHSKSFNRRVIDSLVFLRDEKLDYDFIVQDGCHEYEHVQKELELMTSRSEVNFDLWSHDYYSGAWGVRKALDEYASKFTQFHPLVDSKSDCGFLLARFNKG